MRNPVPLVEQKLSSDVFEAYICTWQPCVEHAVAMRIVGCTSNVTVAGTCLQIVLSMMYGQCDGGLRDLAFLLGERGRAVLFFCLVFSLIPRTMSKWTVVVTFNPVIYILSAESRVRNFNLTYFREFEILRSLCGSSFSTR